MYGCHHDRKLGGYHCHQGPLGGKTFRSQADMLAMLKELDPRRDSAKRDDATLGKDKETCIREKGTGKMVCGEAVLPYGQ